MSETKLKPRLEFEDRLAPRLEPEQLPAIIRSAPKSGTLSVAAGGAALLVAGFAVLGSVNFVVDEFARGPILGGLTLAVALAGFGMLATAIVRELRGLFALRTVDRLRAALAQPNQARRAALEWLATLRARGDALGRTAAVQTFAATAAVPSPALDGLLVAWRGTRLVREIAALYGMRPGTLATVALLRRTALSAATVMATDMATDAAARALLSNPLLAHLAGDVAGAGVAARRMIVLARAASLACAPLPPV
jgi:uncharacterized membrane protein YcjF (UPF0283 family)